MREKKRLFYMLLICLLLSSGVFGCSGEKGAVSPPEGGYIESEGADSQTEESGFPEDGETEGSSDTENGISIPGEQGEPGFTESPTAGAAETEDETGEERFVQKKIVIATDLHYLAEDLSGHRGPAFMDMARRGDGRVLQYGWEILDAFLDEMLKEKPDLVVLSGDLTLDGEKESHIELASRLEVLTDNGIEVAVIPGNHDINNTRAKRYVSDGTERAETINADEFRQIYADFGYVAADSRDPASLSYLYKLDDYYWLLLLDSCQYDPVNRVGGMIRRETYDWMEEILDESWEAGAQVITVSHHNLLEQSGVSREFYDDCTIEHNEELIRMLSDYDVRLHLSGHLHIQHYEEDEDSGIYEVVTGSMAMAPCNYGILRIWNDGTLQYDARPVDVSGWASENSYSNQNLVHFKEYSEGFLAESAYRDAIEDLQSHILERRIFFTDEKMDEMARFYANLCVYYYGGRMIEIADHITEDRAYGYWDEIDYVSELSDFLRNILEDEPEDFAHLTLSY